MFKFNTFIPWDSRTIFTVIMRNKIQFTSWCILSHPFCSLIFPNLFLISFLFFVTAIATVVTVAEILKNNELAIEKSEILFFLVFGNYFPFSSLFLSQMIENHIWFNDGTFLQKSQHQQLTSKMILEADLSKRPR